MGEERILNIEQRMSNDVSIDFTSKLEIQYSFSFPVFLLITGDSTIS